MNCVRKALSASASALRSVSVRPRFAPPPPSVCLESRRSATLKAADLAQRVRKEEERERAARRQQQTPRTPSQRAVVELRRFSRQLQAVHPTVLAKALRRALLHEDRRLVALNKPYGVPVHGGPGVGNNISHVLPILAKMIDGPRAGSQLHLCHRLDKETTGVLLLARSEEAANDVQELFRTHQVDKKYLVVCVGVPVPSEGVIDIPIIEKEVRGSQPHYKMALSPVYRLSQSGDGLTRVRANRQAHGAATRYRVLDSAGGCSLVELQPVTGVKHQIRVHLAYGLGCPVLGDHKYAHWGKLAPQKLPEGVLRRLALEQSKARHLPLHLHARQLVLPGLQGQADITITAPLPRFFSNSLCKLKLSLPEEV
ncbi:pseudouridylate synthase RPUSD4, mitochondrial isoform X2 [Scleropages formosus]|uniref:pseudouridylate synthase RPUSD4, mitochondrial isoform X2 n=1 Tax=Scleropages formosus TaxID=113540 RepID=UPI0008787C55|nr:mitochondrial RNA pseudouridine synthase rpusd4-like isoform X2 [Scleropages formosus]